MPSAPPSPPTSAYPCNATPASPSRMCQDRGMGATAFPPLRLPPLRRQSMSRLVARARDIGIAPEDYARQLIEDGLDLQRQAESGSFADIMKPVRQAAGDVDESEVARLVDRARWAEASGFERNAALAGAERSQCGNSGKSICYQCLCAEWVGSGGRDEPIPGAAWSPPVQHGRRLGCGARCAHGRARTRARNEANVAALRCGRVRGH